MTEQIRNQLLQERILALLSSFFGSLALLLACIGLHATLSYVLTRRKTEIGVRLALGAQPHQVVNMVLRESALVVVLGPAVGIAATLGLSRFVRQFLFGLPANDPVTMIAAAATLSLVALLAAFLPARRASRLEPMSALRRELPYTFAGLYGSRYCGRVSMALACASFTYFSAAASKASLRPSR